MTNLIRYIALNYLARYIDYWQILITTDILEGKIEVHRHSRVILTLEVKWRDLDHCQGIYIVNPTPHPKDALDAINVTVRDFYKQHWFHYMLIQVVGAPTLLTITNLEDMYNSEGYQYYESDTLQNLQHHIINRTGIDPDKFIKAREDGNFGYTHQDVIDNWADYLDTLTVYDHYWDIHLDGPRNYDISQDVHNTIEQEIAACQARHDQAGTTDQEI